MDMKWIIHNTSSLHLMVVTLSYFDPNTKHFCLLSNVQLIKRSTMPLAKIPSNGAKWGIIIAKLDIMSNNGFKYVLSPAYVCEMKKLSPNVPEIKSQRVRFIIDKNFDFLVVFLFSYFCIKES